MPDKTLVRRMIKAMLLKDEFETDKMFLLRFGLVDNIHETMKQWPL